MVAKHGVVGLMRNLTIGLAPHRIRANAICPTTVQAPMLTHPDGRSFFSGIENATWAEVEEVLQHMHALKGPCIQSEDMSNLVLFLASDEARYITGNPRDCAPRRPSTTPAAAMR